MKKLANNSLKNLKDPKAFAEYPNNMHVYKSIEECNPNTKCNMLIVFDDIITTMISNKMLSLVVT